jgi:hypothetical protein
MGIQVSMPRRLLPDRPLILALALMFVGVVLLFGLYLAAAHVAPAATSTMAISAPGVAQVPVRSSLRLGTECSVSGDLVGDANPVEVARVLCADGNERR